MKAEIQRWRCFTEDESSIVVVEYQHVTTPAPGAPVRHYPGARWFALSTGEHVRYIDTSTFEIIETGELLRRID